MATETAVALDSNFKLLLMSRILVAVEKMVASCYNRDQTWLCVYCWCQTPSGVVSPRGDHSGCTLVIARRGETTPEGVWHQQYTHNNVWSLKQICVNSMKPRNHGRWNDGPSKILINIAGENIALRQLSRWVVVGRSVTSRAVNHRSA